MKILITGSNGQLGKSFRKISMSFPEYDWHFKSSIELNITDKDAIQRIFEKEKFDFCINCAAYTAVDKAEEDKKQAFSVNSIALEYLAQNCERTNCILIHISTDFVFDGIKKTAYSELDKTNPINEYGKSKLQGEDNVKKFCSKYIIIRTSWVYSEFGNNFPKTMLRLAKEMKQLNIVNDQFGTPTYAGDIANAIMHILQSDCREYGIYNYSNEGKANWFEFAKAIFDYAEAEIEIKPVSSSEYITKAKRPKNSVLDKSKIKNTFQIEIPNWKESLKKLEL